MTIVRSVHSACATAIAIAALHCAFAGAASAQSGMAGGELERFVAGKTVVLATPAGNLPISYRANGSMSGRLQGLAVLTGRSSDTGSWWVAGDRVCQRWSSWLSGQTYCFTVRTDGRIVHWRGNDGKSGQATIVSR